MNSHSASKKGTLILAAYHVEHMNDRSVSQFLQLRRKQHINDTVVARPRVKR
jgi:hypothetical protein